MFDRYAGLDDQSFAARVAAVVARLGWVSTARSPGRVTVEVAYAGRAHEVVVEHFGRRVRVTASSHARFPPGRFPPVVAAGLAERNEQLDEIAWRRCDGPGDSRAVLAGQMELDDLDAGRLRSLVGRLLSEVAEVDAALRAGGWL